MFAGNADHELFDTIDHHFKKILTALGHQLDPADRKLGKEQKHYHHQPCICHMRLKHLLQKGMRLFCPDHGQTQLLKQDIQEKNWVFHTLTVPPFC